MSLLLKWATKQRSGRRSTFAVISKVDVYDYNTTGDHDFIGEFSTTLEEMGDGEGFQIVTW